MDVAASEFWKDDKKMYDLDFKTEANDGSQCLTGQQLGELYASFCRDYPMVSIEDPFDQDDWTNWSKVTAKLGDAVQIVGDDLTVTNPSKIEEV